MDALAGNVYLLKRVLARVSVSTLRQLVAHVAPTNAVVKDAIEAVYGVESTDSNTTLTSWLALDDTPLAEFVAGLGLPECVRFKTFATIARLTNVGCLLLASRQTLKKHLAEAMECGGIVIGGGGHGQDCRRLRIILVHGNGEGFLILRDDNALLVGGQKWAAWGPHGDYSGVATLEGPLGVILAFLYFAVHVVHVVHGVQGHAVQGHEVHDVHAHGLSDPKFDGVRNYLFCK